MAIFHIERTCDYTVMSKPSAQRGAVAEIQRPLSLMLSLPENWNYATSGLAKICKEDTDRIGSVLKELDTWSTTASRTARSRLSMRSALSTRYLILLDTGQPCEDEPDTACPDTENPDMDNPYLENRLQLNDHLCFTDYILYHKSSHFSTRKAGTERHRQRSNCQHFSAPAS